jgi:hypothetical protein
MSLFVLEGQNKVTQQGVGKFLRCCRNIQRLNLETHCLQHNENVANDILDILMIHCHNLQQLRIPESSASEEYVMNFTKQHPNGKWLEVWLGNSKIRTRLQALPFGRE